MLGAHPANSVHVGDSARFDVDGAARAGMMTVLLDHGRLGASTIPPDLTIGSLEGIAPALLRLLSSATV